MTARETTQDAARFARAELRLVVPGQRAPAPAGGTHAVVFAGGGSGHVYVPATRAADAPGPVVVLLHGAGGQAQPTLSLLQPFADQRQLLLLAPQSAGATWDLIQGQLGPDVENIERMLDWAAARFAIDPSRCALGGFSDGASYAISLGLASGDLFGAIVAFSPGFAAAPAVRGKPRLFVSHGTHDDVLPIDRCSRVLVPRLRRLGYDVTYVEFDGPHTVPADIAARALAWWL